MQNTTSILLNSQQRQLAIDSCIQSVVRDKFDPTVINNIRTQGANVINALRTIEQELFATLGLAYTKSNYDSRTAYIVPVQIPQFNQAYFIKIFHITALQALATAINAEINNDGTPEYKDNFVGDQSGSPNAIFAKSATWLTNQTTAYNNVNSMITTLQNDITDQS